MEQFLFLLVTKNEGLWIKALQQRSVAIFSFSQIDFVNRFLEV